MSAPPIDNFNGQCQPYSDDQIAALAAGAGFKGQALRIAVAVALGESGGKPCAGGDRHLVNSQWGPSVGLWQIRTLKAATGTGGDRDINALALPLKQAGAAWRISSGGNNWQPWTVYKTGAYQRHMGRADAAARRIESGQTSPLTPSDPATAAKDAVTGGAAAVAGAATGALGGVSDLVGAFGNLAELLTSRATWLRVGKVTVGLVAIVLGLAVVFRDSLARTGEVVVGTGIRTGGAVA